MAYRIIRSFYVCDTFADVQAVRAPNDRSMLLCLEEGRECFYRWKPSVNGWVRIAGKFTSIDPSAPFSMATGVLSFDAEKFSATPDRVGLDKTDNTSDLDKPVSAAQQAALDTKIDTDTALSMLADVQSKYDDLNQQFLLLLRFTITTFGQVPEGLEGRLEAALGV